VQSLQLSPKDKPLLWRRSAAAQWFPCGTSSEQFDNPIRSSSGNHEPFCGLASQRRREKQDVRPVDTLLIVIVLPIEIPDYLDLLDIVATMVSLIVAAVAVTMRLTARPVRGRPGSSKPRS
jgi:hypothetical protein